MEKCLSEYANPPKPPEGLPGFGVNAHSAQTV